VVRTIQYMPGNTHPWVRSPGDTPHFVVRINEPYVRVPIDGITRAQEVDNLPNGPVDQLSVDEILKSPIIKPLQVGDPRKYTTLMSMT